jgi:hypothetical protein
VAVILYRRTEETQYPQSNYLVTLPSFEMSAFQIQDPRNLLDFPHPIYLFICGSFNDAVSSSTFRYIASICLLE